MSIRIGNQVISGGGGGGNGESLTNQNRDSDINQIYNWVGTYAEYNNEEIANIHPDWVCYITDDEFGDIPEVEIVQYTARNVGDIFFTSRKDTWLNGAVECDGSIYDIEEYEGEESIGNLLKKKLIPYVSLDEYESLLTENGVVGVFGWDGGNNKKFKVPTLNNLFLETGKATELGEFVKAGLPNITGRVSTPRTYEATSNGAFYTKNESVIIAAGTGTDGSKAVYMDASRSSSIYGNSDTVQPNAVRYRAMVQLSTGFNDEALETCRKLKGSITNCITEIPQDIKLELNNGVLTLKAGSVIYIPNGFEEDGTTPKFDKETLSEDYIFDTGGEYLTLMYGLSHYEPAPQWREQFSRIFSGSTEPDNPIYNTIWYDTENNVIKRYKEEGWVIRDYSLPIAIITQKDDLAYSIEQVFNGFGYIGSTAFVLPGVKGLMPNGRNEDGTLNNKPIVITKVKAVTPTVLHNLDVAIILENNTITYNGAYRYDEVQNKTFDDSPHILSERQSCYVGSCTLTNSVISNFKINTSFHAVDYNEFNEYKEQSLDYNNVSNCITKIPQDIIYELNDGVLTLKKDSKIYIPNGFELDGVTRHFDKIVLAVDDTYNIPSESQYTGSFFLFHKQNTGKDWVKESSCCSGSTDSLAGQSWHIWYHTTENQVKLYSDDASTVRYIQSLPIAKVTLLQGVVKSIQTFNGFGYIGSAVFVLPGVKGLMPYGRNEDGTLRNKKVEFTSVIMRNIGSDSGNCILTTNETAEAIGVHWENTSQAYGYIYDRDNNYYYTTDPTAFGPNKLRIKLGTVVGDGTRIVSMDSKHAFQAVDYTEAKVVIESMLPTDANNYKWYRKYADGWVEQGGRDGVAGTAITLQIPMANTKYYASCLSTIKTDTQAVEMHLSTCTTTTVLFTASFNGNNNYTGEAFVWEVKGIAAL